MPKTTYTRSKLKEFIKENLLDKNNNLNSNYTKKIWFEKRNLLDHYNSILDHTSFVDEKLTFGSRCNHILKDIFEVPKCYCGKLVKWEKTKYQEYCSMKCGSNC